MTFALYLILIVLVKIGVVLVCIYSSLRRIARILEVWDNREGIKFNREYFPQ